MASMIRVLAFDILRLVYGSTRRGQMCTHHALSTGQPALLEADDLRRLDDPLGRIGLGQLFDIEIHKGVKSQAESLLENGVVGIFTEDILLLEAAAGGLEALENRENGRHVCVLVLGQ